MVSKKHILTFVLFLASFLVNGQQNEIGLPYVENISSAHIGYSGDLIEISQDAENVMYFTHEKGVVVFDGASWNLLPTHGTPTIFKRKNGRIVVGFENFIGEISMDNVRQRRLNSLTDSITNVGHITSIVEYQENLFFVARGIVYSLKDGVIEKLDVPKTNKLFVDRTGVIAVNNQSSWFCTDLEKGFSLKKDVVIDGVLRTNTELIIHTKTGFTTCESVADKEWQTLPIEIDNVTSFVKLITDEICVGVNLKGLYCFDKQGNTTSIPSLSAELSDSKINGMFVDKNGNLWVTHGHGVSRLELNHAISYFNEKNGLEGSVNSILRVDGKLYVATDRGVFVLRGNLFKSVLQFPCSQLVQYKKSLIAATENGLYKIDNENTEHICTNREQIIYVYDKYLVSIGDGIFSVWNDSQHTYPSIIPIYQQTDLPDIEVSSIAIEDREKLLAMLGTKNDGVWMMGIDSVRQFYLKKCTWQGIPRNFHRIEVYETAIGVVFSTEDGIYRSDVENGFFYRDAKIQIPADMGHLRLMPVVEDNEKNLWFSLHKEGRYENQVAVAWNTNNFERYTIILAPFAKLRNFNTSVILPEDNSIVWFGGEDGLARMDFNRISVRKTLGDVCLVKVSADQDSLLSQAGHNIVLPYGTKSIAFDYVAIEYENHDDIFYSYFLEGQDDTWSLPSKITSKEYTNLPPGKYAFHVIAKRASGATSKETIFSFEIKHHPLLTPWAFLVYLILLVALVIWLSKIRASKLARETKMMNALVEKKIRAITEEKQTPSVAEDSAIDEDLMHSQSYELATVLFSDFKGFSKLAEKLSADSLIKELDTYFSEFDTIISRYNVEKIKTVGDSYMCAGGIPKRNTTNPIEVVAAALEMQYRIKEMQKNHEQTDEIWGVRIGVHTGPVIAGVVGSKNNLSYDIWGDSVNVADRMESAGEVGKVNISESTYLLVQDFFDCEYRGKVAVKGKDEKLDMYFVMGFKQEFAKEGNTSLPNNIFYNKFALLRFESLQEQVCGMFEAKLPKTYFYHSMKHTLDVVIQAEMIAIAEGVDDESLYVLKTAALLHDIGFIQAYDNHENISVNIAKDMLPKEGYSQSQIDDVCRLIMSTKLGTEPKDLLEKVLCDANFDYLGRDDFSCVSKNLYKELLELRKIKKNEYEWSVGQLKFLQEHKFYTNYSRNKRNSTKVKHIQDIQEKITRFNI